MPEIMEIVKALEFERLAGTEGEKRAAEIITSYVDKMGLSCEYEPFPLYTFEPGTAKIVIQDTQIEGIPFGLNENFYAENRFIFLDNPNIVGIKKAEYRDKIVVGYGYSRKLANDLKESDVQAYIAIGTPEKPAVSLSHRQSTYSAGYIPTISISYEDGIKLKNLSGSKGKLIIEQKVKKSKASNIVVNMPGKGKDENLTLITAHYDTVAHSPGAIDNSGGVVAVLKAMEYFSTHKPSRDIRFIFFSGEEVGLLGSQNYLHKHKDELKKRAGMVINIDLSGDIIGVDTAFIHGSAELKGYFDGVTREQGLLFQCLSEIHSSDIIPFTQHEIPGVSLSRRKGKANHFIHTHKDDSTNVTEAGYKNTMQATINFARRVVNAEIYPYLPYIDESLKEKMEKYIWNLTGEEPILYWTPKYKR